MTLMLMLMFICIFKIDNNRLHAMATPLPPLDWCYFYCSTQLMTFEFIYILCVSVVCGCFDWSVGGCLCVGGDRYSAMKSSVKCLLQNEDVVDVSCRPELFAVLFFVNDKRWLPRSYPNGVHVEHSGIASAWIYVKQRCKLYGRTGKN